METQIGQTTSVIKNSKKNESGDSDQLFPLPFPVKSHNLSKQYIPTSETVIKDKDQQNRNFVSEEREKRSCHNTDVMPVSCDYILNIKLEDKVLIKGRESKNRVSSVMKREHDVALQNTLQSESRKRRRKSSSLEVGSQGDIVIEKIYTSSLLEHEEKTQSSTKNAKNLKKKCKRSLIMRRLHEMGTVTEKDGTSVIINLDSENVSGNLQKSHSHLASESKLQHKRWNFRKRIKPIWPKQNRIQKVKRNITEKHGNSVMIDLGTEKAPENLQKSCSCVVSQLSLQQKTWNFRERIKPAWPDQKQHKNQRIKRSICKLDCIIQNIGVLKYRENFPKSQIYVKYPINVSSAAVTHFSSTGNCIEGIECLMKNAMVNFVKQKELTVSKLQKSIKVSNGLRQDLLDSIVDFEENRCKSNVKEGINRMVTQMFSKSKIYTSDGEKQSWKSERSVAEIVEYSQWILKKKVTEEQMDCLPKGKLLVTKTEGTSKEERNGKDEIVSSTDLKKEIKTFREDTLDILSRQYGRLPYTILNILKNCNIETALEQSACLLITEANVPKNNNSVKLCFWKQTKKYCNTTFSITNTACLENSDIRILEKKIEKSALVKYRNERFEWLSMYNVPPCKKSLVVKSFDCYYIKTLQPTGIEAQSYIINCGSLRTAFDQGKSLTSKGMGQNELSSIPNVIHNIKLITQKDILVSREMSQHTKSQNAKRIKENKLSMDFKKPCKKLKMPEDLEESSVMKVLINEDISAEHDIPIEENTVAIDSAVISEKLDYNETSIFSLLDCIPDFSLELPSQNQVATMSSNETADQEHFIAYGYSIFEKPVVLKTDKNESKEIEPFIDFSKMDENKSIVETVDIEKNMVCNSNATPYMKRKRTCNIKTKKTGRKPCLYSCQRVIPISGKNTWPRESCARTSLSICKNHALDSHRGYLEDTDSVTKWSKLEVHKPLVDSCKISLNTMECAVESPFSDCILHMGKIFSPIENRFSYDDTERSKQSTEIVESKVVLNLLKEKGKSINIQNDSFASIRKNRTDNPSVTKQNVLKNLTSGTLSNFKIPLLEGKGNFRKLETETSSEKDTGNSSNILENVLSPKEARIKMASSDKKFSSQIQSEQENYTSTLEKYMHQFNSDISENVSKKRRICNTFENTSHKSKLKSPTLNDTPFSLNTGNIEEQMLNSALASEIIDKVNVNNKLARENDDICPDILKAYEDDILVIDVIQDDPDLFGDNVKQEDDTSKINNTKNIYSSHFSEKDLEWKSESSQFSKSKHLKFIRESRLQDYETLKLDDNADGLVIQGGISESFPEDGQLSELNKLTKVFDTDEKYEFSKKLLAMQEQKTNVQDFAKIENTLTIEPLSCDHQWEWPFPTVKAIVPQQQDPTLKSRSNDFRFPRKCPPLPSSSTNSYKTWKEKKHPGTYLGLTLPRGYCRYYFNSLNSCENPNCWFSHVLESTDDKLCSEIIKKYISIGGVALLQRAVHIFSDYCKKSIPVYHLDLQMFHDLLTSLLQFCLLKELFHVVRTGIRIKILPNIDILLKIFEQVTLMKVKEAVPELSDIFYKLIDTGMVLEQEHIRHINSLLNQLHDSSQEITMVRSRFQERDFHKAIFCDFDSTIAAFKDCKEKSDWTKLGTLYVKVTRGCKNADYLEKYSWHVASILISSVKEEKPGIPFCEFATAVHFEGTQIRGTFQQIKHPLFYQSEVNVGADRDERNISSLGRIGISVMFSYYKVQQWSKAKKILDMFHALRIHFTLLKGLQESQQSVSRCQVVNVAVEIFLKCRNIDGALWVLRGSEWIINTAAWPCEKMDVLNRHNLLCAVASELMTKNRYDETFEVLKNLPGFQNTCDSLDVSQYGLLFNKLLRVCSENRNIETSSTVVAFMLARNIHVEFNLLRALITALGRSCLWLKARKHYKSALALGCYPPLEGNLYRKLLLIPSYMSEVEMLLAIEIFLVSNASSIQSPGASSQILQIVLKRCEGNIQNCEEYQNATERLFQAAQISNPKLFINHLTVNVNKDQIYSLEHTSVLKWLKENMKWAGKAWLF